MDTDIDNSSIASLDYKLIFNSLILNELNAKIYYSYVDHIMSNSRRPNFRIVEAVSSIDAITTGGKIETTLKPSETLTVFTGIDAFMVSRDGKRNRLVKLNMMGMPLAIPMTFTDKIWQDSYINDFGLFAETKYAINTTTFLTAGLRLDLITSDIKDPEDDFASLYTLDKRNETNISGTLSVKKKIAEHATLEVAYSRGVRSANMIERYINHFTVGQDAFEYLGNPNLKAEVNNQFEIGISGKTKLSENGSYFNYGISGYYSKLDNTIIAVIDPTLDRKFMPNVQPQEVKRFVNIDNAYKTGFEMSFGFYMTKDLTFNTDIAYVYTKNKDLNEALQLTAPLTSRFELLFEKEMHWLRTNHSITSKQDHLATSFSEQETAGYNTFDLRLGIKPIKNIILGLAVLNLFNETYSSHLNFAFRNTTDYGSEPITDPGRNFSAYIKYNL